MGMDGSEVLEMVFVLRVRDEQRTLLRAWRDEETRQSSLWDATRRH